MTPSAAQPTADELSSSQRSLVLAAAFLAWMFAGLELSLFVLVARPAMIDILGPRYGPEQIEQVAAQWFAWYQAAVMFGAAAGGWVLGSLGDTIGRARAMAASVLCYSAATGVVYLVDDPFVILLLRFATGMGIGGTWPSAVALAVEGLPRASKPLRPFPARAR